MTALTRFFLERLLTRAGIAVGGSQTYDINVVDHRFFRTVLTEGSLGLGEAYLRGWWTCNDLEELAYRLIQSGLYKASLLLPLPVAADLLHSIFNQQSRQKSLRVAVHHYSLGNDVFLDFLGRYHNYSCGYFVNTDDLDVAQRLKLEKVCRLLDLRPGERVLDVGGGWGEFAKYAATHHGCHVTSINIADEQIKYAKNYCNDASVEIRKCDYRDLTGQYDKILVMAMLTHVGYKNYRLFMEIMHRCLTPGGTMLIESVGGRKSMKNCEPWIDRYIFPGGVVPSLKQIDGAIAGLFSRKDLDEFGASYVHTLRAWNRNFQESWPAHQHRYDERFRLMFEYFFQTVAGAFRAGYLLHWHILLEKSSQVTGK